MLKEMLKLMRPQQWYKNLVIFIAIFFVREITNINYLWATLLGFIALCLVSSGNYAINDILDRKKDAIHPEKKNRPIASGKIKIYQGILLALVLLGSSFYIAYSISLYFFYSVFSLFGLTLLYSTVIKNEVFADIILIAINFVIRAMSGVFIINVDLSPWLVISIFFLAIFLVSMKRKADLILLKDKAAHHKAVLKHYSLELLQVMIIMSACTVVISYCLYSFLKQDKIWIITIPFVVYSVFRYLYLVETDARLGRHPELILKDKKFLLSVCLWLIISTIILYVV